MWKIIQGGALQWSRFCEYVTVSIVPLILPLLGGDVLNEGGAFSCT